MSSGTILSVGDLPDWQLERSVDKITEHIEETTQQNVGPRILAKRAAKQEAEKTNEKDLALTWPSRGRSRSCSPFRADRLGSGPVRGGSPYSPGAGPFEKTAFVPRARSSTRSPNTNVSEAWGDERRKKCVSTVPTSAGSEFTHQELDMPPALELTQESGPFSNDLISEDPELASCDFRIVGSPRGSKDGGDSDITQPSGHNVLLGIEGPKSVDSTSTGHMRIYPNEPRVLQEFDDALLEESIGQESNPMELNSGWCEPIRQAMNPAREGHCASVREDNVKKSSEVLSDSLSDLKSFKGGNDPQCTSLNVWVDSSQVAGVDVEGCIVLQDSDTPTPSSPRPSECSVIQTAVNMSPTEKYILPRMIQAPVH